MGDVPFLDVGCYLGRQTLQPLPPGRFRPCLFQCFQGLGDWVVSGCLAHFPRLFRRDAATRSERRRNFAGRGGLYATGYGAARPRSVQSPAASTRTYPLCFVSPDLMGWYRGVPLRGTAPLSFLFMQLPTGLRLVLQPHLVSGGIGQPCLPQRPATGNACSDSEIALELGSK